MSTPPSLRYQASINSSHSQPYSHSYASGHRRSRNNSLEQLVPKRKVQFDHQQRVRASTKARMGSNGSGSGSGPVDIEAKKSYGIGGAGNIRRPSDAVYTPKVNADGTRRASVWSNISVSPGSSPEGRRGSIMALFRKNSVQVDGAATERKSEEKVEFKDVDMGGRS